jgi:hypothetical protein
MSEGACSADVSNSEIPVIYFQDVSGDPYDALIPVPERKIEAPSEMPPEFSPEDVERLIRQMELEPSFLEHFTKLPFVDDAFLEKWGWDEYLVGEEKEAYLKRKLHKKMAEKREALKAKRRK